MRKPPRIAAWLLGILTKPEERYAVIGDFEEEYSSISENSGFTHAYWWYWKQLFWSIPSLLKGAMWRTADLYTNYTKVALRNIKKYKMYSLINIAGLSIGITCCILIFLYFREETSYDTFHKNADRIYRSILESSRIQLHL